MWPKKNVDTTTSSHSVGMPPVPLRSLSLLVLLDCIHSINYTFSMQFLRRLSSVREVRHLTFSTVLRGGMRLWLELYGELKLFYQTRFNTKTVVPKRFEIPYIVEQFNFVTRSILCLVAHEIVHHVARTLQCFSKQEKMWGTGIELLPGESLTWLSNNTPLP